jgi:hypothetical protein
MTSGTTPSRRPAGRIVLALAVIGLASAAIGCGSSTDSRPATWSYVSTAILQPSCATANCHSALAQRAQVDLSTRAAGYHSLVDRHFVISKAAVTDGGAAAVNAGAQAYLTDDQRIERSQVINLMHAEGNLRMPPDMPLPETDIQLVERWIREGAFNN